MIRSTVAAFSDTIDNFNIFAITLPIPDVASTAIAFFIFIQQFNINLIGNSYYEKFHPLKNFE